MWFDLQFFEFTPLDKILLKNLCSLRNSRNFSRRFRILYLSDSYFVHFIVLCRPLLRLSRLVQSVRFDKDAVGLMFWCLDFFCRKMLARSNHGLLRIVYEVKSAPCLKRLVRPSVRPSVCPFLN
jgi:hypothetical protein